MLARAVSRARELGLAIDFSVGDADHRLDWSWPLRTVPARWRPRVPAGCWQRPSVAAQEAQAAVRVSVASVRLVTRNGGRNGCFGEVHVELCPNGGVWTSPAPWLGGRKSARRCRSRAEGHGAPQRGGGSRVEDGRDGPPECWAHRRRQSPPWRDTYPGTTTTRGPPWPAAFQASAMRERGKVRTGISTRPSAISRM